MMEEIGTQMWGTDPAMLDGEVNSYLGGFGAQALQRFSLALMSFLGGFIFGGFWAVTLGIMLMGAVLFKSGFLKGEWSLLSYLGCAVLGLGISYGSDYVLQSYVASTDHSLPSFFIASTPMTMVGLAGGFGYAALIAFLVKTGLWLKPFAAAGRMAFTNYIACSLIGTTMAYGHGGAMFGDVTLEELMWIVGGTYLAILIWSPLWLAVFRFGPLEWLWRSLTYGKMQPLLK